MQLLRLEVTNWRGLDSIALDFGKGVTIVGGPNESGKSTLRDALRSAFLLPGKRPEKKVLEGKRPWGSKLFPKVSVDFILNGDSWQVEKEFLRKKDWAALRQNKRLLVIDDEVQPKLLDALGPCAEWIDVLWGEQGESRFDNPVPDSVKGRLAAAAQDTVMPEVVELERQIAEQYKEYWTPGGQVKKSVQQVRLNTDVRDRAVQDAKAKLAAANSQAADLDQRLIEVSNLKSSRDAVEQELNLRRQSLGAWETYRRAAVEANTAETAAKTLSNWLKTWHDRVQQVQLLWPESQKWQQQVSQLRLKTGKVPSRDELKTLRDRQTFLECLRQRDARAEVESMSVPTSAQLKEMRALEDALRGINSRLKSGELRAKMEAESPLKLSLSLDGEAAEDRRVATAETLTWTAEQGFELVLPGIARLHVESGSPSVAHDMEQRIELQRQLDEELGRWETASIEELQTRATEREARLKVLPRVEPKALAAARSAIGDADVLEDILAEDREKLLDAIPSQLAVAEATWKRTQDLYVAAQAEYQSLTSRNPIAELTIVLKSLTKHVEMAPEPLPKVAQPPCSAGIAAGLHKELVFTQSIHGGPNEGSDSSGSLTNRLVDDLTRLLSGLQKHLALNSEAIAGSAPSAAGSALPPELQELSTIVSPWEQVQEEQQASCVHLRSQISRPDGEEVTAGGLEKLQEKVQATNKTIEEMSKYVNQGIGAVSEQGDLYARFALAEEELAGAREQERRANLQALSVKMLHESFEQARDRLQRDVVAPLQERVSARLSELTTGFYRGVTFDTALKLSTVLPPQVESASFDDISFGTREQLALLNRLCLAELLAEASGRQCVILDDNLVHTDDQRMTHLCRLLETASESVQIIVFTCHPERYSAVRDKLEIKVEGRRVKV